MVLRCLRGYDYFCTREETKYPKILLVAEDDSDHTYEYDLGDLDESVIDELSTVLVEEDIPHRFTNKHIINATYDG